MDDRESAFDQNQGEDDSFLDETTDGSEETMSQTTPEQGRGKRTDISEWETEGDEDEYGHGYEPARKKK